MKILFVENHPVFAKAVIKEFLADHQVHVVPGIKSAIDFYTSQKCDLVLVDYDLDDGKDCVFISKQRALGDGIPIIAVSSHDPGNQSLLRAGANAMCPKMQFKNVNHVIDSLFKGASN